MNENKTELFHFLAKQVVSCHVEGKELYSTYEEQVLSSPPRDDTEQCSHEEADKRLILHVSHASHCGHRKFMVRTIDTDVIVLAVSKMADIDANEVWIAFGAGKHFRYLAIHDITAQLGTQKAKALPMLRALTGCDTVSFFTGRGKRTAWDSWNVFDRITYVLVALSSIPESIPEAYMQLIERFVVLLYSRTSAAMTVNEARQQHFSKGSRTLQNIPLTQAALTEHTKRAAYQAGHVCSNCQTKPSMSSRLGLEERRGRVETSMDSLATSTRVLLRTYSLWLQERVCCSMQMSQGKSSMHRPMQLWWTLSMGRLIALFSQSVNKVHHSKINSYQITKHFSFTQKIVNKSLKNQPKEILMMYFH